MPACNHESLAFGSGDYYVTCQQCGLFWVMMGRDRPEYAATRADATLEAGGLNGYAVRKRALSSSTG